MLITRYLMRNLASATVFVTIALTMVVLLTQSLKILELVANSDAPPGLFIKLIALTIPKFLETILPVALVIAALFVYNRFIMDNELIVLRACGFDQHALIRPALLLAGGFTLVMFALTTYVTPVTSGAIQSLRATALSRYSSFLLREGVFNTFGKDLTVYVRSRSNAGDLSGILIHDNRDKSKPPSTTTAKRGRLIINHDVPTIVVQEGMRQQLDPNSNALSRLYFAEYMIEVNSFDSGPRVHARDYSERTLPELLNPDLTQKYDRDRREVFLAEAHADLVRPLLPLAFVLPALAILLIGPFNRRGQGRKVTAAVLVIVALMTANLVLTSATRRHLELAPLLYLSVFLPIFVGFYALNFRGEQQIMAVLRHFNAQRSRRMEAAS
ncbi:MAG TPA: LptF/LptG family permease [Patescibacteria group bacterium]|nr:LptF/LptG family permease [Patescibacteria group bacterium]